MSYGLPNVKLYGSRQVKWVIIQEIHSIKID